MTFELFLITMIGLPLQLEGKAASTHQLARQAYTCTEAELEDLTDRWRASYLPAARALRTCGDPAVPGLIEVMTDETVDLNIRQLSARLLAQIGSEEAIIALLDATSDEALQTSIHRAVRVLNRDSSSVVPLLADALESPEISRATAAAKGLAHIASEDAINALLEALREEASQDAAFIGLGEINSNSSSAVDVLIAALRDESEIIQVGAAYGLAEIGTNAEAAIPELAELLRVSEEEYLHPDEGSEARGMAAYALGKINPLHEEALKALGITVSLGEPAVIGTADYYPELKEEVKEIAAEALDEIDNILFLLDWNRESYIWHMIALIHQPSSELTTTFNEVLSEEEINSEIQLNAIQFIGVYPTSFMPMNNEQDLFLSLFDNLLTIVENQNVDVETKYYGVHTIFEIMNQQQGSYVVHESVVLRLAEIAKNEGEDIEIRQGAVNAINVLLYGGNYHNSPELQYVVEALVEIAEGSRLYSLWREDYEQLQSQGMIDWNDIGAVAMIALLYSTDWSFCSNLSFPYLLCEENRASPAGVFLSQLEQTNPELFEALRQNARLPFSPYEGPSFAEAPFLAASVILHQRNNQPAICRYGIAQRLVPRCR